MMSQGAVANNILSSKRVALHQCHNTSQQYLFSTSQKCLYCGIVISIKKDSCHGYIANGTWCHIMDWEERQEIAFMSFSFLASWKGTNPQIFSAYGHMQARSPSLWC